MKSTFISIYTMVSLNSMLSSTTYPVYGSFNRCVYCDKDVENDYFEYEHNFYQSYRCNCKKAKQELLIKEEAMHKLKELESLNKFIDTDKINKCLYNQEMEKLKKEYNQNYK